MKSKLFVIDFQEKKTFETKPRNVGGIRDFNRIDADGIDQNVLEKSLSEFEGSVATALRKLDEGAAFKGEIRELILNLIALFAVRSPERRQRMGSFQAEIIEIMVSLSLSSKERWESLIRQMKEGGQKTNVETTYEDVKRFHDSKAYTIEFPRERHIEMEIFGVKAILPCIDGRAWLVIKATPASGPFITSDNPVNLTWNDPESIPPFYRNSPGLGYTGIFSCLKEYCPNR